MTRRHPFEDAVARLWPVRPDGRAGNAFRHGLTAADRVSDAIHDGSQLMQALMAERPDVPEVREAAREVARLSRKLARVQQFRLWLINEVADKGAIDYRAGRLFWQLFLKDIAPQETYERKLRSLRQKAVRRLDLAVEEANGGWRSKRAR